MPPLPADDLIARCRRVYAECETYADEGEQRRTYTQAGSQGQPRACQSYFRMRWRRPDHMYFEFRKDSTPLGGGDIYVIWSTPASTQSWWTVRPRVEHQASLQRALAAACGVTGGTSSEIPDLLRPRPDQRTLPDEPGFVGELGEVEGMPCLAIAMEHEGPGDTPSGRRLWIDLEHALIRRIDEVVFHPERPRDESDRRVDRAIERIAETLHDPREQTGFLEQVKRFADRPMHPAFRSETTTLYRPNLNVPLDDAEFEFTPPT